ncbi:MAG: DNA polymerase [Candidatus Heimdallarchaeota archaeon]
MKKKQTDYKKLSPLPPLKKYKQRDWVGFDCETYTSKNKFYLVTFFGNGVKEAFYNKKQAQDFIKKNPQYSFVAHNLQFDYNVLFNNEQHNTLYKDSGDLIYNIKLKIKDNKHINFYETGAFFRTKLETLGKVIGAPKLDPPYDLSEQRKPRTYREKLDLEIYCYRDSEIAYGYMKYVDRGNKELGIQIKNTIGSTSIELFRRKYLKTHYEIEPTLNLQIAFKGYYGGRTEVIKRGTSYNINYFDIRSMYPSVMLKGVPDPNSSHYTKKVSLNLIKKFDGISQVEIIIPKVHIPPLPFKQEGRLCFPTGLLKGYWTNIELRKALEIGAKIIKFGEGTFYSKWCYPFNDFINDLFKKRKEAKARGDNIQQYLKTLMNSCYGKFAYNFFDKSEILHISNLKIDKDINTIECNFNERLCYADEFVRIRYKDMWDKPTNYSIPIWSAYITAHSRLKLYEVLNDPCYSKYVCYMDTDSIMLCDGVKLQEGENIGEWELECFSDKFTFIRAKMYMGKEPHIKGFSGINTKNDFFSVVDTQKAIQQRFLKPRTVIFSRHHHKLGIRSFNEVITIVKKISLDDTKRIWEKETFKDGLTGYREKYPKQDSTPIHITKKYYENENQR